MNLHEYQAKDVFRSYGIPVPAGRVAASCRGGRRGRACAGRLAVGRQGAGARRRPRQGRRRQGGARPRCGARRRRGACSARAWSPRRPGPRACPSSKVYVETGSEIAREIYLSLTLNRERGRIALIASAAGGMDIEEVAAQDAREDPRGQRSIRPPDCRPTRPRAGLRLGPQGHADRASSRHRWRRLYRLYIEKDASLVEVNPLIVTKAGALMALDAKINIDANAVFRHPELAALRDAAQEDPMERRASEHDLNYVSLDGDIACMVNGAGLAMATMDLIKLHGGAAGELPRRRRRRHQRARDGGLRADPLQSERCARSW